MTISYRAGSVWWGLATLRHSLDVKRKYWVLLNDCLDSGDRCIAAFTTSKGYQRYPSQSTSRCGCPTAPYFRIEEKEEPCFPVTTWVQFDVVRSFLRSELESSIQAGRAGYIQMLVTDRVRAVMNCALRAQDLPKMDQALIAGTLKVMDSAKKVSPPAARPSLAVPTAPASAAGGNLIQTLRVRFESHGASCRVTFHDLVQPLSEGEVAKIFSGSLAPPANFVEVATAGLDLIAECCTCGKPAPAGSPPKTSAPA